MVAASSSSFRQSAAVAVIAGAAVLASFGVAKGQQLAATDVPSDRAAYLERQCGHILDATARVGCRGQASIDFDNARTAAALKRIDAAGKAIAEADQRINEADRLQRCTAFLRGKRDSGTVFDRKITRENACPYAIELGMRDGPG